MKTPTARIVIAAALAASSLLTVSVLRSAPPSKAGLVVEPDRTSARPTLPPNLYAEAARALRNKNLQQARQLLDQVSREHPDQAAEARVIAGLYAHEAGDAKLARELLQAASAPGAELEDWRLLVLARDAAKQGDRETARATYARLISDCPESTLLPLAYFESAELADDLGEERAALDLIAAARKAGVDGEMAGRLDSLAWSISRELDDLEAQRDAGRRLLTEAPLSSDALEAVRTFRAFDDRVDWSPLLSTADVVRRAQSFLSDDSLPAALTTLESVPETERDFRWHLLKARALTSSRRGVEALSVLNLVIPSAIDERAGLEWERALAAADAATVKGSGGSLPAAERARMLEASHRYLINVIRSHASLDLEAKALRRIYDDFKEAGLFEPALAALRILRRIDPADGTGTSDLWEQGWNLYQSGNASGAVGVWSEMEGIYPDHRETQRARYWNGRALEELGQPDRARAIYAELAASSDTSDFYFRQALARLGEPTPAVRESTTLLTQAATAPWPSDPALLRTKRLTDLGLDALAAEETELVSDRANPRELLALKAIVLCRQGEQRSGLILLREAYPALGGPYQASVPLDVLHAYYPLDYADEILAQAERTGLPASLIAGIIRQESAFDARATSPVGARGLMQLMPATAREVSGKVGIPYQPDRLYTPEVSIRLGSAYFREVLDGFEGNVELALAGYNGGPNRIRRLWNEQGEEPRLDDFLENLGIDESRNYVKRILVLSDSYRQLYPSLG
ncbi:MAG TPA: transglycosylase SLT domain-containing protein [Thermoanaerobaculia bacterium]|nr:transglycosylase SLT domain-containing protein [Thermoanaerobaculia bacterium]